MQRNSVDLALGVLNDLAASQEIRIAQANLSARRKPEEFLRRVLHEIFLLDIELASELDLSRTGRRIVGVIDRLQFFNLPFRIILDHDLERTKHRHPPQRGLVERFADGKIEHPDVNNAIGLCDADALDEIANGLGRNAAPAQARQGRHARVVPSADVSAAHQLGQHALG